MFKFITKPIGCLYTLFSVALFILLLFVGLAYLGMQYLLPSALSSFVESQTGFTVNIEENDSSVFSGRIAYNDLSVHNPGSYQTSDFLYFRTLVMDLNPASLQGDEIVIEEVIIDLDRVSWVRNENGDVNLMQFVSGLKAFTEDKDADSTQADEAADTVSHKLAYVIKKLHLRIGNVNVYRQNHADPKRHNLDYQLHLDNVRDPEQIISKLKSDLAVQGLGILASSITDALIDTAQLGKVTDAAKEIGSEVKDIGKDVGGKLKDTLKDIF